MTRTRRFYKEGRFWWWTLALLLLAPAAVADDPPTQRPVDAYWAERLAEAEAHIEALRLRLESAETAYAEARHAGHPRGEALQNLIDERNAAQEAYREAERAFPELLEQARRAGVYAEVLRPYRSGLEPDEADEPGPSDFRDPTANAVFRDPTADAEIREP